MYDELLSILYSSLLETLTVSVQRLCLKFFDVHKNVGGDKDLNDPKSSDILTPKIVLIIAKHLGILHLEEKYTKIVLVWPNVIF